VPALTKIEWTDFTSNPVKFRTSKGQIVWACAKVSAGCTHCYAETLAKRYGRGGPFNEAETAKLTPYLCQKELRALLTMPAIRGKRVFIGDMTDIFGEWVPIRFLVGLWMVFASRPDVTFQVLTKRAGRAKEILSSDMARLAEIHQDDGDLGFPALDEFSFADAVNRLERGPLPNVWLSVSCEDQSAANERIPLLLQTPATVRGVSLEPLIGPIDLSQIPIPNGVTMNVLRRASVFAPHVDWVIVGGESGPSARHCDVAWIRSIVQQCQDARVPVLVKQLGRYPVLHDLTELPEWPWPSGFDDAAHQPERCGLSPSGLQWWSIPTVSHPKGGDMAEWPKELRLRQYPVNCLEE